VLKEYDDGSNPFYAALALAGEAGEICGKMSKVMRDEGGVPSLESVRFVFDECGDNLWFLADLIRELNRNFSACAMWNLVKLRSRKVRGKLHGDGGTR
jgi:hypothetical protein